MSQNNEDDVSEIKGDVEWPQVDLVNKTKGICGSAFFKH